MTSRKVLMASANYWQSPFRVGTHHLARGFVEAGWEVAFISDPITPFHLATGLHTDLRRRIRTYRLGGISDLGGHLWTYVPCALAAPQNKPLLRSEWLHRNWATLTLPNVVTVLRKHGFSDVDVLYFDNPNQHFLLNTISFQRSVFRVADRSTGFRKYTPAMGRLDAELVRAVDVVAYTALTLRHHVEAIKPKDTLHLPNGVDFRHFAEGDRSLPLEYASMPRPIAVYVGAMDYWFNYELVNAAVEQLPHVSFVLIGPSALARKRLRPRPNLHLLGRRPYEGLPPYLHNADVGLIPFDVAAHPELIHAVTPLKLYEYMACGLPVVAPEWEELKAMNSPAVLCKSVPDFVKAVAETTSARCDAVGYKRWAAQADWKHRVSALIEKLELS